MPTVKNEKKQARTKAFARRAHAFETAHYDVTPTILSLAEGLDRVALYMPMRTEMNPLDAMAALVEAGKVVGVPIVQGAGLPLKFHEWRPDCVLEKGAFGALTPVDTPLIIPKLVIAPLVAFDHVGTRLGYGGGFYDRTLAILRHRLEVKYCGLAFDAQRSAARLPKEKTDIPLDGVITESGYSAFSTSLQSMIK